MARQMVDVMNEINTSSKKIEDIINVIDSIGLGGRSALMGGRDARRLFVHAR